MNHSHDHRREDAVETALVHVEKAECDLAEAHAAEVRAEVELHEAVDELAEARFEDVEIVVNAQPRVIHGHEVTFEEVVRLAFPEAVPEQNVTFSMTYRRAATAPHAGELAVGGRIHVKQGTVFNVTRTVQS